MPVNPEKLRRLQNNVRIGGKGSVRRKKKAVHKAAQTDDKRLAATLKRMGVQQLPDVDEVNMFKLDGTVIHFENPKGTLWNWFNQCVALSCKVFSRLFDPTVLSEFAVLECVFV